MFIVFQSSFSSYLGLNLFFIDDLTVLLEIFCFIAFLKSAIYLWVPQNKYVIFDNSSTVILHKSIITEHTKMLGSLYPHIILSSA